MSRRRQDVATVRISDEEYSRLESKFEALRNEFAACRRKLDSKCEALLILSKELDQCRSERDQFKLMAEQLRERCQTLKRSLSGKPQQSTSDTGIYKNYTEAQSQNLARLLYETKEVNKSLQFEVDDLKQKLNDAQGDIKLLREQIARSRVGTTDEGMSTRHFPAHEREELVQKLESSNEQYLQLERDLQTVLDEKEELVTERDVYKTKYERLNQELNYILKGDENRVVDIDALVMENKYLQERLKQMEEEKSMAMAAVSKYKSLLERRKTKSSMKLGQSRGGGLIITQKQVQQVLDSKQSVLPSQQAMSDLQALAGALLDSVNDKNLALSHQRKTNKILGNRVAELEKKIKTLECAGLWNIPANISSSLEKLKQDSDDVKMLIPRKHSDTDSEQISASEGERESELESVTPLDSVDNSPMISPLHTAKPPASHVEIKDLDTDLDLLPTKEVPQAKSQHLENSDKFQFPCADIQGSSSTDVPKVLQSTDVCEEKDKDLPNKADFSDVSEKDKARKEDINSEENTTDSISDVSDLPLSVQVYSQDKIDETFDSQSYNGDDEGDDLEDVNFCSQTVTNDDISDEESKSRIENTGELDEFYDDGDDETSQNVGLLMESMTQKMCKISHQNTEIKSSDVRQGSEHESDPLDGAKRRGIRKERENSLSRDSAADGRPLLSSQGNSLDDNAFEADEPHDIEC